MPDKEPETDARSGTPAAWPRRRFLATGMASLLSPAVRAAEKPWLVYCGEDFPPYSWADAGRMPRGMDVEIVAAILDRLAVPYAIEQMTWSRALASLEQGVPDLLFELVPAADRFTRFHMVGPFRTGETVFAVRADSRLTFDSLDDLRGLIIGTGRRYSYLPEFDQATHFTRDPAPSDQLSLRKLVSGRVDMVVGDRFALSWKARREGLLDRIRFLPRPLATAGRYVALPLDRAAKADRLRSALAAMLADGSIDAIVARWRETG